MKKFVFKTFLFGLVLITSFLFVLSRANGETDAYYLRFTTPKQQGLILGSSRSAQSLMPSIFKSRCNKSIFNYAFTGIHSPFGKIYYESIFKKLDPKTKNGLFIIDVSPTSVSSLAENPNDEKNFRENGLMLDNTKFVNLNPNFLYLYNEFSGKYFNLLLHKETRTLLHKDGWLEVNADMNKSLVQKRTKGKIKSLKKNLESKYHFSEVRFNYLIKIIKLLEKHGDVYLVRLPVHTEILALENSYMPNFNKMITKISGHCKGYLDLTPRSAEFRYTDGNHIYKPDGKRVSRIISDWICKSND